MPIPGLAQPKPVLQVFPAQQASPLAPQGSHEFAPPVTAWQERPEPHWLAAAPPQQASLTTPQAVQVPPTQRAPGAVQVMPVQQVWVKAPQTVPPVV